LVSKGKKSVLLDISAKKKRGRAGNASFYARVKKGQKGKTQPIERTKDVGNKRFQCRNCRIRGVGDSITLKKKKSRARTEKKRNIKRSPQSMEKRKKKKESGPVLRKKRAARA